MQERHAKDRWYWFVSDLIVEMKARGGCIRTFDDYLTYERANGKPYEVRLEGGNVKVLRFRPITVIDWVDDEISEFIDLEQLKQDWRSFVQKKKALKEICGFNHCFELL